MAAEMAVESTAQEEIQTEDRHQTVREDHLAVDHQTVLEEASERVTREEATAATVQEELTVRVATVHREEPTVKAETVHREELMARAETGQEDHVSVVTGQQEQTVQEEATARVLREEHTVEIAHREEHMATVLKEEVTATALSREDLQEERISATSAARRRAESAR